MRRNYFLKKKIKLFKIFQNLFRTFTTRKNLEIYFSFYILDIYIFSSTFLVPPMLSELLSIKSFLFESQFNRMLFFHISKVQCNFSPQTFRQKKIAANFLDHKIPFCQYALRFYCLLLPICFGAIKNFKQHQLCRCTWKQSSKAAWNPKQRHLRVWDDKLNILRNHFCFMVRSNTLGVYFSTTSSHK